VNSAAGKGDGKIERRSPEEGYTTYYYSCRCDTLEGEKEKEARNMTYQRAAVVREWANGSRNAMGKRL